MTTQSQNPLHSDLDSVLDLASDVWPSLRNGRLFITGGTGFFGMWLLESLLWANRRHGLNIEAVVLSRDPEAFTRKAPHLAADGTITLLRGDVRTFPFPESRFTHVIHAAMDARASAFRDRPLEMMEVIVDGTRRVLDFAVESGARRFLYVSSGGVYGDLPSDVYHASEEIATPFLLNDKSVHTEGKRLAEALCFITGAQGALEPVIARCFAFVGPHLPLDEHFAAGNFIRDGLNGGPIRVGGDGTPWRSYLYASDLAVWLWTLLVRGTALRAYNVGSESALTIAELANRVADALSPRPPVVIAQQPAPGLSPHRYVPATERARIELGLKETVDLPEAIARTILWNQCRIESAEAPRASGSKGIS